MRQTSRETLRILFAPAIILLATAVSADTGVGLSGKQELSNPLKPSQGLKGLFATEKFDMQQTVGLNFGTGQNRFSQYYLNSMTYKVSEPLTIQATLGIQNQSVGTNAFGQSTGGARLVVPNVGILYQPKPNLRIEFGFSNAPQYGSVYDPFWGRIDY